MDPIEDARALVSQRFPDALAAFLGNTVLSAHRTATSDLDILVILAGPPAPYRESLRFRSWPVETFVHDMNSLDRYFARDHQRRRPTLARLCADSEPLAGQDQIINQIRERGRSTLAAGPRPLGDNELALQRYGLTDLLDDLAGSADPGEIAVIGWNVWTATAELALLLAGHWLGSSKWQLRELRAADPVLAEHMEAAFGDPALLTAAADEVLGRCGGRLWAGFRLAG